MNTNIWFTSQDLITVSNPPVDTIWTGIPQSGAYAGYWCYKDSTGTIYPIGSGIDNISFRAGQGSIVSPGRHIITFGTPFAAGTNYIVIVSCVNSKGSVDCNVTTQNVTGFTVYVSAICELNFICRIINDIPIIV